MNNQYGVATLRGIEVARGTCNEGIKKHLRNRISFPIKSYILRRGFVPYIVRRELVVVKEGSQVWILNEYFVEFAQLNKAARECIAENCLANLVKLPINETDSYH